MQEEPELTITKQDFINAAEGYLTSKDEQVLEWVRNKVLPNTYWGCNTVRIPDEIHAEVANQVFLRWFPDATLVAGKDASWITFNLDR